MGPEFWRALREGLRAAARCYLLFAAGHVGYKLCMAVRTQRNLARVHASESTIPWANPNHALLGISPGLIQNLDRAHDWRRDLMLAADSQNLWFRFTRWDIRGAVLMTSDPSVVKHILKTRYEVWDKASPRREWIHFFFSKLVGRGFFTCRHGDPAEGELHRFQRKLTSDALRPSLLNSSLHQSLVAKARVLIEVLHEHPEGQPIDMQVGHRVCKVTSSPCWRWCAYTNNTSQAAHGVGWAAGGEGWRSLHRLLVAGEVFLVYHGLHDEDFMRP